MSRIRSEDTRPEKLVRSLLHRLGYRFRLHVEDLPGKPDVVLPRHEKVIFVHGCFWHGHKGCKRSALPASNREFWERKFQGNMQRDKRVIKELRSQGWTVLIVWQCELRNVEAVRRRLARFMDN